MHLAGSYGLTGVGRRRVRLVPPLGVGAGAGAAGAGFRVGAGNRVGLEVDVGGADVLGGAVVAGLVSALVFGVGRFVFGAVAAGRAAALGEAAATVEPFVVGRRWKLFTRVIWPWRLIRAGSVP